MERQSNVNKKERKEERVIDGVVYRITIEESDAATETPYDVISRLIRNNKERICCLDTNGGREIC